MRGTSFSARLLRSAISALGWTGAAVLVAYMAGRFP